MRRTTAARLALLVVTTALMLAGFTDSGPNGACPGPRECGAGPLPAPVTVTAGRVSDRIARDGHALRIAPGGSTHGNVVWFPGTGTWFELQHGHRRVGPKGRGYLVVGRGPRGLGRDAVWRSRAQFAADSLGLIAAGPNTVAFQHDHRLYLAASGGGMRPVARRELPLGWTTGGLYTYSYPRRELLLRDDAGAVVRIIARRPSEYAFDLATGRLYFFRGGALWGARGAQVWRLGSLRRFGMSPDTYLQPLGGLIALLDNGRLTVVRPDGSLVRHNGDGPRRIRDTIFTR